ncbi:hypothetical protein [Phenylobacterium sp.]|uniref:hypothetical protein n=1 Tax=Phenylobacterium sp. TaxID=1871053 RepID=UPI00121F7E58|nr:hypothetical protein [Phenylobacterium sp.]THD61627.1 MAG: hypothetical protein E8A49_11700 [Phenylobacterium sp.]
MGFHAAGLRSRIARRVVACGGVCLAALTSGCASTQLNADTRNLNQSTAGMDIAQVLDNISVFLDPRRSANAIPSQIIVSGGQASTQYTVTPQMQYGSSNTGQSTVTTTSSNQPTVATTSMIANGALTPSQAVSTAAATTVGIANEVQKVFSRNFSVPFADQWSQNWTIQVITDGDDLRKLTKLYNYASRLRSGYEESNDIPMIDSPVNISFGDYVKLFKMENPQASLEDVIVAYKIDSVKKIPDPYYKEKKMKWTTRAEMDVGNFHDLCLKVTTNKSDFGDNAISLSQYGHPNLWMDARGLAAGCLQKFVFLIHDAEGATAGSSSTSTSASKLNDNVLIFKSPIPNSTTFSTIPNAIKK